MRSFEFKDLKPEDSFSPEQRQYIDSFWDIVAHRLSDQHKRDLEYTLFNVDVLRGYLTDSRVLEILSAGTEDEVLSRLPPVLQGESAFAKRFVPSIQKAYALMRVQ